MVRVAVQVDQYGQVIDVLVSPRRNADVARTFFTLATVALATTQATAATIAAALQRNFLAMVVLPRVAF